MENPHEGDDERHPPDTPGTQLRAKHQQQWEEIFQAIGHPSFILDPDHRIVACNKAVTALTGKPAEHFIGKKCYEVFHSKGGPPQTCPMEKLVKSGRFETVEMEMEALGRTFLVSCTPVRDESGALYRIIHIATEITDRKLMEQKLREGEERCRIITENLPDGVTVHDLDGRFIQVNKAMCEMTGYTEQELTSMTVADIDKESITRKDRETIWDNLEKGDSFLLMNATHQRKDGSVYPAEIRINSIVLNREPAMLVLVQDISERTAAEEKLRIERDKAQKYLDIAAVMFVALDASGTVTLINKRGCEILGTDESRIIGKNWFETFLPADIRENVKSVFTKLVTEKIEPVEYFENPVIGHDGKERIIAWHNTFMRDEAGNITRTLSSGTDITQRKINEQKLNDYRQRLKDLATELSLAEERERRRIAMGIHDDLGQKLVMAKFRLQALRETVPEKNIKAALNSECNLIGEILDDIRSLTFELSNPLLYEVGLEQAMKHWLKSEIQEKAHLKCEFVCEGEKLQLDDDIKVVLFKAVRELLTNIIKHAKAKIVKVSMARRDSTIAVTVEDDGVGFDTGKLTLPSGVKGGFGLFNIKERLEYMGGRLDITSEPGKGTRVVMTVPAKKSPPQD